MNKIKVTISKDLVTTIIVNNEDAGMRMELKLHPSEVTVLSDKLEDANRLIKRELKKTDYKYPSVEFF